MRTPTTMHTCTQAASAAEAHRFARDIVVQRCRRASAIMDVECHTQAASTDDGCRSCSDPAAPVGRRLVVVLRDRVPEVVEAVLLVRTPCVAPGYRILQAPRRTRTPAGTHQKVQCR